MWFSAVGYIVTLPLSLLAMPLTATAQPAGKLPRIGLLMSGSPTSTCRDVEAFCQGLRDLGYVEDQTIALEVRWDEHTPERWLKQAAALVRLPAAILVAGGINALVAVQHATTRKNKAHFCHCVTPAAVVSPAPVRCPASRHGRCLLPPC